MTKTDTDLQKDVLAELTWDPAIQPTDVGATVRNGVVTLTGHVSSYAEKDAAERAAARVDGVRAIAVELSVRPSGPHQRDDGEIAQAAEQALQWHAAVPNERVKVLVEKGWVTLTGDVDWDFQRKSAEHAIRPLIGVLGVINSIRLAPLRAAPTDLQNRIQSALLRQALREAKSIEVDVGNGGVVTLQGKVHSLAEREAAVGAAWSAPGVTTVVNKLSVAI